MDINDDYSRECRDLSNGYCNHKNGVGLSTSTDLSGSQLSQNDHHSSRSGNSFKSNNISKRHSNGIDDTGIKNNIQNQTALCAERNLHLKVSTVSKVQPKDGDHSKRSAQPNGIVNSTVIAGINKSVDTESNAHAKGSVKIESTYTNGSVNTEGSNYTKGSVNKNGSTQTIESVNIEDRNRTERSVNKEGSIHINERINIEGNNHTKESVNIDAIEGSTQTKGAGTSRCNVYKNGVNSQDSVSSSVSNFSINSVNSQNNKSQQNNQLQRLDLPENIELHLGVSDADNVMSDGDQNSMANQSPSLLEKPRADSPMFDKPVSISSGQPSAFASPNKDKRQEKPARKSKIDNKDFNDSDNNPDVHKFLQATDTSDLRLVVEGKPLYVSRIVLSIISPVLKQIFDNRTRESSVVEIPLAGKKFEEMLEFLHCVYPDKLKPITDRNVVQLLALADELQVDTLKSRCEQYLLNELKRGPSSVSPEFLIFNMQLADKYNLELIKKQCFEVATRTSTEALENVAGFWDLPHLTTSGIFLQRLKLFEQAARKISKRLNEAEMHCSLYHKNERWGDNLCNKCLASVGKVAGAEMSNL